MHIGRNGTESKTEAVYFPADRSDKEGIQEKEKEVKLRKERIDEEEDGSIHFTRSFKYLGSIISSDLKDDEDVKSKISNAGRAFYAMRVNVFGRKGISLKAKSTAFTTLIMPILLYGCENWTLTEKLTERLRIFTRKCYRIMCRITMLQVRKYRLKGKVPEERLKIGDIQCYLTERFLRWHGHIARMPSDRLPRKFLSSYIFSDKKQNVTTSRTVAMRRSLEWVCKHKDCEEELKKILSIVPVLLKDVENRYWLTEAQDRSHWRRICKLAHHNQECKPWKETKEEKVVKTKRDLFVWPSYYFNKFRESKVKEKEEKDARKEAEKREREEEKEYRGMAKRHKVSMEELHKEQREQFQERQRMKRRKVLEEERSKKRKEENRKRQKVLMEDVNKYSLHNLCRG